jgi:hypothetical protein
MEQTITRVLAYYPKGGDTLAGEDRLAGVGLDELRGIFGIAGDDPMYDCYPIGPGEAAELQRFVDRPIDLTRYDYFVECEAETPSQRPR